MPADDQGVDKGEFDQLKKRVDVHAEALKKQLERTKILRKLVRAPRKHAVVIMETAKQLESARDEIKTQELTIKRLERQLELVQKEVGQLRKEALTEADIKPFKALLKK